MQKFRLAPLARNHYEIFLKCLVFSSRSYQECYIDKDISAPTKYLIDQQDIEISKNFTCKPVRGEIFIGSLVIVYKFLILRSKSYHECYKHKDITKPTKYVTDQNDINWDLEQFYGLIRKIRKFSARSLRSLVIIYETFQVYTLITKPISWVLGT